MTTTPAKDKETVVVEIKAEEPKLEAAPVLTVEEGECPMPKAMVDHS